VQLLLLLVACGGVETMPTPFPDAATILPDGFDVQGHRGARGLKPENSYPAFETALDLGVTTLELDLHFTADNTVVIWHDPVIEADKCGLDGETAVTAPDPDSLIKQGAKLMISNLTFAQLQAYRCDRNPDPDRFPDQNNAPTALAGDDYGLISLAELFDFVDAYSQSDSKSAAQWENARRVQFNMETKREPDRPQNINDGFDGLNPGPFELAILALVSERGLIERVILQSFDHRSLWAVRAVNTDIRLAALTMGAPQTAEYAANGATIWSPNFNDVTLERLIEAHALGLQVIPWTVNNADDGRRLINMGVDGLISDRPDLLLELGQ